MDLPVSTAGNPVRALRSYYASRVRAEGALDSLIKEMYFTYRLSYIAEMTRT
jgi:hypothetical protein